ncbi:MAG: hypothetical protein GKR90_23280 [Pseudomonadales bacterium]|nr:hypothetical protein [Pseudomonadales bacterium]
MQLLVRNRVQDFAVWLKHFEDDHEAATAHGLVLIRLWRSVDEPNNIFFLFEIETVAKADAFMARPESQEIGIRAGVLDGEFYYLEEQP